MDGRIGAPNGGCHSRSLPTSSAQQYFSARSMREGERANEAGSDGRLNPGNERQAVCEFVPPTDRG